MPGIVRNDGAVFNGNTVQQGFPVLFQNINGLQKNRIDLFSVGGKPAPVHLSDIGLPVYGKRNPVAVQNVSPGSFQSHRDLLALLSHVIVILTLAHSKVSQAGTKCGKQENNHQAENKKTIFHQV